MSEGHEPGYYVNEGVDSFESGLWDGPGADEFDPYTRFDVDFDFEAAFGLNTSESAGPEVPDHAAANIEQTQEACGAEEERDTSDSEAFPRSALQEPYSGTENEALADSLDNSSAPVRSLDHMGEPPGFSTSGEDSRYNGTSSSGRFSHATALSTTQFQGEDAVQTSYPVGDPAWPAHAQYWSSENEERVHDQQQSSNFHNAQGNSGHEQLQPDLGLGHQNFGQNASDWEFPIEDFFGPIDSNAGLLQQPDFNTTARPLVTRDEKDDDPNDEDRDDEDDDDDEEYDEEEDLPSQVTSVTYPVNDPLIVEDPIQKGWGRTGIRNGSEVWFNPKLYKWRKWSSPVQSRLEKLIEDRTIGVAS